jgi:DNA-binding FadR family transcriptional regulator
MLQSLFELRFMVEPAAAALAATHRTQRHLDDMRCALALMQEHTLQTPAGRIADQEFHAALLGASGNPFVMSLTNGVTAAVAALTEFKQRSAPLKRDPIPDHVRVYDAIAEKNSEGARKTMAELIRLALLDTPIRNRAKAKKR